MPFISITASDDTLNRLALAVENLTAAFARAFPPPALPYSPAAPTQPDEVSHLDLAAIADREREEERQRRLEEGEGEDDGDAA